MDLIKQDEGVKPAKELAGKKAEPSSPKATPRQETEVKKLQYQ